MVSWGQLTLSNMKLGQLNRWRGGQLCRPHPLPPETANQPREKERERERPRETLCDNGGEGNSCSDLVCLHFSVHSTQMTCPFDYCWSFLWCFTCMNVFVTSQAWTHFHLSRKTSLNWSIVVKPTCITYLRYKLMMITSWPQKIQFVLLFGEGRCSMIQKWGHVKHSSKSVHKV